MRNWYDMIMIPICVDMDGSGDFEFCCKKCLITYNILLGVYKFGVFSHYYWHGIILRKNTKLPQKLSTYKAFLFIKSTHSHKFKLLRILEKN